MSEARPDKIFYDRLGRVYCGVWSASEGEVSSRGRGVPDIPILALPNGSSIAFLDEFRVRSMSGKVLAYLNNGLILDERGMVLLWSEEGEGELELPKPIPNRDFLPPFGFRNHHDLRKRTRGPMLPAPSLIPSWSMISPESHFERRGI